MHITVVSSSQVVTALPLTLKVNMFHKWLICASLFALTPGQLLLKEIQDSKKKDGYIACDEGWFLFGEICYKLFGADRVGWPKLNWENAKSRCESYGGHLATVQSQEIQDFLFVFLLLESDFGTWIGLNDIENETHYKWTDGTDFSYSNWNLNEPSEFKREGEDCVHMILQKSIGKPGKWNDRRCNDELPYICQVDKGKQNKVSHDPTTCTTEKGGGWKFGDSCYNIVKESMNWDDAEKYCQDQYKGHLVTILNLQTEYFLNYIMRDFNTDIWIGIKIKDQIQQKFSSGWPVVHTNSLEKRGILVNGTCVVRRQKRWEAVSCAEKYPLICEVSTVSPPVLRKHMEDSKCPEQVKDWVDLGGEYCYFIDTENDYDWYRANVECIRRESLLASFHSKEELNALSPYAKNAVFRHRGIFLGIYKAPADESRLEWFDGSEVDFTYWNEGEPNTRHEKCVEALIPSMKWNDQSCELKMGYICAVKKLPSKMPENGCDCTSCQIFKVTTGVTVCILFVVLILLLTLNYFLPWKEETKRRRNKSTSSNVTSEGILRQMYVSSFGRRTRKRAEDDSNVSYSRMD